MTQVVTNENMLEFIEKRSVPEFKAPEKAIEKPAEAAKPVEDKPVEKQEGPPRGEDGKFVAEKVEDKAAVAADDDEDESDLPERVRKQIKQIGKKHRAMKEAEEFATDSYRKQLAAEKRAEAAEAELAASKAPKSGPASDGEDKEPNPDDFKTVGEYTKAYAKYEVAKALRAERTQSEQQRQQQATENTKAEFGKRVAAAMKSIPDYEEIVSAADVDVPAHVAQYIVESEMGPLLGYHLAKHGEDLDRIKSLSPIRAIAELGKLEASLEKTPEKVEKTEPATPQVSRAPAPITPLEGKSTTVEKDPSKMSFKELREYERNRERQQRAAR
jgi:hypothetical protein